MYKQHKGVYVQLPKNYMGTWELIHYRDFVFITKFLVLEIKNITEDVSFVLRPKAA